LDQAGIEKISPGAIRIGRFSVLDSVIGRAIVSVPMAMALWWFLLKPASLWLLRILAWLPLAMFVAPPHLDPIRFDPDTQEWVFNVAVNTSVTNPQTGERQRFDSVEFAAPEGNVAFFACGWFCYLALAFAAAGVSRRQAKSLLKGLGVQTFVNVFSLAAYAYINGYGSVVNVPGKAGLAVWLCKYFYYLIYLVVPYAAPFAIALLIHCEWRAYFTIPEQRALSNAECGRSSEAGSPRKGR
jgi:hypothetical protein